MKAMVFVKRNACPDLSTQEFASEWKSLTDADKETLAEWAVEQGEATGVEVTA